MVRCRFRYVIFHAIHWWSLKKQGFFFQHVRVINITLPKVEFSIYVAKRPRYIIRESTGLSLTDRRDHEVQRPRCARTLPCCFLSVAWPSLRCDCEDIPIWTQVFCPYLGSYSCSHETSDDQLSSHWIPTFQLTTAVCSRPGIQVRNSSIIHCWFLKIKYTFQFLAHVILVKVGISLRAREWAHLQDFAFLIAVLKRDGTNVVTDSACKALSGNWVSPYDNVTTTLASDLDIVGVISSCPHPSYLFNDFTCRITWCRWRR